MMENLHETRNVLNASYILSLLSFAATTFNKRSSDLGTCSWQELAYLFYLYLISLSNAGRPAL